MLTTAALPVDELLKASSHQERMLVQKVLAAERITAEEGAVLFDLELGLLGHLADEINKRKNNSIVYFNRNFHVEPTNVCVFDCKFCSYSRLYAKREEGWELTSEDILNRVKQYDNQPVTEVHIVGGVHPKMSLGFFCEVFAKIKAHRPDLHIKAFTAVELEYMIKKAKVSIKEGLLQLKASGLDSLPGGGAEIFHPDIRTKICKDKVDAAGWLHIHRTAHQIGLFSNATMLYGHIEQYEHRIDHMEQLRKLQDETYGFNTFIPLKFLNQNNEMHHVPQVSSIEDLKMYAVARIFMDNFKHIKAYWPMMGKTISQLSLHFGVNDLDGTIDDSTKIYAMAGAEEQHPTMSTEDLVTLIKSSNRIPVERDTNYNNIKQYA